MPWRVSFPRPMQRDPSAHIFPFLRNPSHLKREENEHEKPF